MGHTIPRPGRPQRCTGPWRGLAGFLWWWLKTVMHADDATDDCVWLMCYVCVSWYSNCHVDEAIGGAITRHVQPSHDVQHKHASAAPCGGASGCGRQNLLLQHFCPQTPSASKHKTAASDPTPQHQRPVHIDPSAPQPFPHYHAATITRMLCPRPRLRSSRLWAKLVPTQAHCY